MFYGVVVTEADALRQISGYLLTKGYFFWRNNTGAFVGDYKGKSRFVRYGHKGSGDILGLTKEGKFFSIEVKRKGKKASPDQNRFMTEVLLSKGIAFVAYSVDDVMANGL